MLGSAASFFIIIILSYERGVLKMREKDVKVYFDGSCSFCRAAVKKLSQHDVDGRLDFVAIQSMPHDDLPAADEAMMNRIHCLADGKISTGISALIDILSRIKGYKFLLFLLVLGKTVGVGNILYDFVANHRYLIPVNKCHSGSCDVDLTHRQ